MAATVRVKLDEVGKHMQFCNKPYLCLAVLGALGVGTTLARRAIPSVLTRVRSEMMRKMMAQMADGCCDRAVSGCGAQRSEEGDCEQPEPVAATSSECGCAATSAAEAPAQPQMV